MIDQRFTLAAFEACTHDNDESARLVRDLQVAISEELLEDVRALGEKVAIKMRELGHPVAEFGFETDEDGRAAIEFIDTSRGEGAENHRLRISLDLVISVGFPGYGNVDDPLRGPG